MKRIFKIVSVLLTVALIAILSVCLFACDKTKDRGELRFAAPQGTPALAMLRLAEDNKKLDGATMDYAVVAPSAIQVEMRDERADIVIMPINAGAKLINQGKDYKLVSVAVEGSLFLIGNKQGGGAITFADIKGKKIACIGQNNVPGLTFEHILKGNGIEVVYSGEPTQNQVLISYVAEGSNAKSEYEAGRVDFMVVGEPAATMFKAAPSSRGVNAEMNLQLQYSALHVGADSYPQAGLFVRTSLANDRQFMNALFDALGDSKDWVEDHPAEVTALAKKLYESASFPAASILRCAIDCDELDNEDKNEIIAFLKIIAPTDSYGNPIDWEAARGKLF